MAEERVCLVVGGAERKNATLVFCWDATRGTFSEPRLLATGCSVKVRKKDGEDVRERDDLIRESEIARTP